MDWRSNLYFQNYLIHPIYSVVVWWGLSCNWKMCFFNVYEQLVTYHVLHHLWKSFQYVSACQRTPWKIMIHLLWETRMQVLSWIDMLELKKHPIIFLEVMKSIRWILSMRVVFSRVLYQIYLLGSVSFLIPSLHICT